MPIRVDARIRRDRKTWSIYYSLFQYRRCDRQRVSTSKTRSLVLFFPTLFALFALFDTEKNKKRYSTPTTPLLPTRTILRSLDKKLDSHTRGASSSSFPFFVVAFLFSRRARLFDGLLCFFFFLYLSRKIAAVM